MKNVFVKSLLVCVLASVNLFACWFTTDNFDNNYIAGVNNFVAHFIEGDASQTQAQYINGSYVALPLTPYVKIKPRVPDTSADNLRDTSIKCVIFRYRVFSSSNVAKGDWTTVKFMLVSPGVISGWDSNAVATLRSSLPEPYKSQIAPTAIVWNLNYDFPVALFGKNCISPKAGNGLYNEQSLTSGDVILLQYYLNDGLFETGDLTDDINPSHIQSIEGTNWQSAGRSSFTPPFIFKVVYNGRKRIVK